MRYLLKFATLVVATPASPACVMLFALLMIFVWASASQAQLANTKISFVSHAMLIVIDIRKEKII